MTKHYGGIENYIRHILDRDRIVEPDHKKEGYDGSKKLPKGHMHEDYEGSAVWAHVSRED